MRGQLDRESALVVTFLARRRFGTSAGSLATPSNMLRGRRRCACSTRRRGRCAHRVARAAERHVLPGAAQRRHRKPLPAAMNATATPTTIALYQLAHGRTGDKGDRSNISVIAYDARDFDHLVAHAGPGAISVSVILRHNVVSFSHRFVELGCRAQCAQCTRRRAGCDAKKSTLQHRSDYL